MRCGSMYFTFNSHNDITIGTMSPIFMSEETEAQRIYVICPELQTGK